MQPTLFGAPSSATFSGTGNLASSPVKSTVRSKGLTRAQKLTRALKACHKKKGKRRAACVRKAKVRYAAKPSLRTTATKKGRG